MFNQKLIFIVACLISLDSYADVGTKLNGWFDDMNYSNVTAPGVYESQGARQYTLGGISTRAPITQPFNIVNVQTPRFSAGCGGIDVFTGGFDMVDADQFVENLRAIGQNAQSLAFMLAIQIVSPQLSGVMEEIQSWAEKLNSLNMDSCEAARALVGGTMEMFGATEANCTLKRMEQFGESYGIANNNCTTNGNISTTEAAGGDANMADFVKGNIAWYVLMQDTFFSNDLQFAELIMNLTGTVIITDADATDDGPNNIIEISPALLEVGGKERFNNIFSALLYGANSDPLQIYRCQPAVADKAACLSVSSLSNLPVNFQGLSDTVQALIDSIVDKIGADSALSTTERGILVSTTLPLYRYLTSVTAAVPGATSATLRSETTQYAQFIAKDIIISSLQAIIDRVDSKSRNLDQNMSYASAIKNWREQLDEVAKGLNEIKNANKQMATNFTQMRETIRGYEKEVISRLGGSILRKASWTN